MTWSGVVVIVAWSAVVAVVAACGSSHSVPAHSPLTTIVPPQPTVTYPAATGPNGG